MSQASYVTDSSSFEEEGWFAGWNRFWFAPSNPTTLGLIRIATGILTLYTHLIYTFDLQQFFGKDAWNDLQSTNERRYNSPKGHPPADWPDEEGQVEEGKHYDFPPANKPLSHWNQEEQTRQLELIVPLLPWSSDEDRKFLGQRQEDAMKEEQRQKVLRTNFWLFIDRYNLDPRSLLDKEGKPLSEEERRKIIDFAVKHGADPRKVEDKGFPWFSIWFHVTDPTWMMTVHVGVLIAIVLFTLGFCTRITAALTWLGAISYIHRAPTALFGQDTMMNIQLIYLMIGPSGAALSIDRLIQKWWAQRRSMEFPARPEPSVAANFAYRLIQIHLCMIYIFAGASKLQGGTWWNGTALWYTLANNEFAPLNRQIYRNFLRFLSEHRWLWECVMTLGNVQTLFVELCFTFLVWNRRLRWFMLIVATLMHAGIALLMGLTVFQLYMLVFLLPFFPEETVQRLLDALREAFSVVLPGRAGTALHREPATAAVTH
jgi:hypothetical protein